MIRSGLPLPLVIALSFSSSFCLFQVRHPTLQHDLHLSPRPLISLLQFTCMLDQVHLDQLLPIDQICEALELGSAQGLETDCTVSVNNCIEGRS